MGLPELFTVSSVVALVLAEARGVGVWATKPLASTGFLWVALARGALGSAYGRWIFAALVLSWWGDVLLLGRGRGAFLAGLGSFLLAHLAFSGAFLARGVSAVPALGALAVTGLFSVGVARWLLPHVDAKMKPPVVAYVTCITAMVSLAAGAAWSAGEPALALGAVLFLLSDLAVARDRFVAPGFDNRAWGLPLYYAAQVVLARTV
ncbi:MAG: lysoplasmalogenase [Deltaproteobacteria bacterium]|nr:lysoplasmalogenase [Deltaproteobacteria bacterium]